MRTDPLTANNVNQYTQRTVPGNGSATNLATVTVNLKPTQCHRDYFRAELNPGNSVNPVWQSVTTVVGGNVFVPKAKMILRAKNGRAALLVIVVPVLAALAWASYRMVLT